MIAVCSQTCQHYSTVSDPKMTSNSVTAKPRYSFVFISNCIPANTPYTYREPLCEKLQKLKKEVENHHLKGKAKLEGLPNFIMLHIRILTLHHLAGKNSSMYWKQCCNNFMYIWQFGSQISPYQCHVPKKQGNHQMTNWNTSCLNLA